MQCARSVPVHPVGRDERGDCNGGAVGEELGDFGDAADVLIAVFFGEAQVFVKAEADVVTVEAVGVDAAVTEELVLEFDGDGGFARRGEAGKPDCEAALVAQGAALLAGQGAGVVGDVSGLSVLLLFHCLHMGRERT